MRQSKFTETPTVSVLKEAYASRLGNEILRKYGHQLGDVLKWKAKGRRAGGVRREAA